MIEFLKRLFGHNGSSATAKERLRLVLMTDHLELAPEMIETMKRELVDVISRHVEVDRDRIEVNFERQDSTIALLANIPIVSVNRPNGKAAQSAAAPPPQIEPPKSEPVAKAAESNGEAKPPRKRRRRKKSSAKTAAAPAVS